MDLQSGEGNNNQSPPAANAAAVVNRPLDVGVFSNPLDKPGNVDTAVKLEAAAQTPTEQFKNQFGSGPANPPTAESNVPDLMNQALANLETTSPAVGATAPQPSTDNLAPEQTQPAETLAQPDPEQTPGEKLKQQIAASVDAFLEEVTKEKVAA